MSPALLRPLPSGLGTAWHLGDRALLLPAGAPPYPQLAAAWPDVSGKSSGFHSVGHDLSESEFVALLPDGWPHGLKLAVAWPDTI